MPISILEGHLVIRLDDQPVYVQMGAKAGVLDQSGLQGLLGEFVKHIRTNDSYGLALLAFHL